MTLQERLDYLDKHFGFRKNPEDFNFKLDPEKVAYRNEALRTANRDLYAGFLADKYPNQMEAELQEFDKVKLKVLNKEEALGMFNSSAINLLQSDFEFSDPDAIFKLMVVDENDISWYVEENDTDLLNAYVTPDEVLNKRDSIILDVSRVETFLDGKKVFRGI